MDNDDTTDEEILYKNARFCYKDLIESITKSDIEYILNANE